MRGPEIQYQTGLKVRNFHQRLLKAHQTRKTSYDVCFTLKRVLLIIPIIRNNLLKVHPLVTHLIAHYIYLQVVTSGRSVAKNLVKNDILSLFLQMITCKLRPSDYFLPAQPDSLGLK